MQNWYVSEQQYFLTLFVHIKYLSSITLSSSATTTEAMDLINKLMNIVFAPLAVLALYHFLPTYHFFKYLLSTYNKIFSEDVSGKVVLITGASSGIGEHLAYEYARRGACLALVARRKHRLQVVAAIAEEIGSPDAIILPGDVTKTNDCQEFVDATVKHFVDHLVANAGVTPVSMFEDVPDITNFTPTMDINFWGSVYSSHFAIPHLKRTKGKIIVIASCASWLPTPRMSFYNASKAALVSMYETLRIELAPEIGITIVTPGLIESEMTGGKFLNQQGQLEADQEMRDVGLYEHYHVILVVMPVESTPECAKAIVKSACRGEKYLTEPDWYRAIFFWKVFCPDVIEWSNRFFLMPGPGRSERDTISKNIVDVVTKVKEFLISSIGTAEFPDLVPCIG
ncbi:hypothetical protein JCGZ_26418 [Jatropha curcas]|uniref:Uncharacterized protein n=1 Tax=Jatropha curcas TaxID=180498 RepID=A0A067JFH1_JATCU|nr:hypothetical protein JCGZ_26418 [Jatropha curcas]